MKIKKVTKAAAVVASVMALSALAACGNTRHEHEYGDWIEEIPSTCTTAGVAGHYHCDGCGKNFDADRVEIDDVTIDAAHTFSAQLTYVDGTGHFYPAICEHTDERSGFSEHSLVASEDGASKSCVCGYTEVLITELATPQNLAYDDFIVTFDAVEYADAYKVEFVSGSTVVATYSTAGTTLDLKTNRVPYGTYTIKVTATRGTIAGAAAELSDVHVLTYDGDTVIEAETATLTGKHFVEDAAAHGGGYADGIKDCGQGLYFRYYAYEAGEREMDIMYATAEPNSYMGVYVGGTRQRSARFKENTGLFDENKTTAKVTVKITLEEGWNEIYLIKDGSSNDEPAWGGNAQIDYIVIHGTNKAFDDSDFDIAADTYKLEAEAAEWHWANEDQRPAYWQADGFSLGYGLGEILAEGDGVTFRFKVNDSGAYAIQLAWSGKSGGAKVKVTINDGTPFDHTLSGGTDNWKGVVPDTDAITVNIAAGEWFVIDFAAASDTDAGDWWCADYLLLTKIDHMHEFTEQRTTEAYLMSEATCTQAAKYYYSCAHCDEAGNATFDYGRPNGHSYATTLTNDDPDGHYYAATCEHTTEKKDFEAHTLVDDADGNVRTCACGYSVPMVDALDTPANLAFGTTINTLTFDAVPNAKQYVIDVYIGNSNVETTTITTTSFDLSTLVDPGRYTVKVKAKCVEILSDEATLDVNVLVVDGDVIIEAEDCVLNSDHISVDSRAHGGGYVLGIDNCGQGLYIRYFAYEAGERDVDIAYATGSAGSYMGAYVNGERQASAVFSESTGWFGDNGGVTAIATVSLSFAQGWNEIILMKDGKSTDSPQYGGWAQIDYIKVYGTGKGFDVDTDKSADSYKLEAELAKGHHSAANKAPITSDGFSSNYAWGDMNAEGDGVTFRFKVSETGTYKLTFAYSGGSNVNVDITVNGGDAISRVWTGNDNFASTALDEAVASVELTAGEWIEIDVSRRADSSWYCLDYLLVTKVGD